MGEDTSLADFLDGEETSEHADGGAGEAGAKDRTDVASATATYRVTAGPEACPDCGATARRFWRDDDAFVCGDCKEW